MEQHDAESRIATLIRTNSIFFSLFLSPLFSLVLLLSFFLSPLNFSWKTKFSFKYDSCSSYTVVPYWALLNFEDLPSPLFITGPRLRLCIPTNESLLQRRMASFIHPGCLVPTHLRKRERERTRETEEKEGKKRQRSERIVTMEPWREMEDFPIHPTIRKRSIKT